MRRGYWAVFLLTSTFCLGFLRARLPAPDPRCLSDDAIDWQQSASNILPEDYVGPEACAGCHRHKYDLWSGHAHGRMNQLPSPASVRGDFAGQVLRLPGAEVQFTTANGAYRMAIERGGAPLRRYEVTRTVGSRFMQFYIGRQLDGPEPPDHPLYREHMLPFAYWISLDRWLPKHYFDPDGSEKLVAGVPLLEGIDHIRDVRPYTEVCMNCHNTFPYAYRIFHDMFVGFPDATVAAALGPLSSRLSATRANVAAMQQLNGRLDPDRDLVTLGISCESCHFGGREHAREGRRIRFTPTSPFVRMTAHDAGRPVTGERANAATVNGICSQCHSGNSCFFPNGAASANSREALDFHRGACASQLRCVSCHEPHTAGPGEGGPDRAEHLAACVSCHDVFRDLARARTHAGHPAAATVTCLDCHMPRQTLGLDELVRTHRIAAPVEQTMVDAGSANACNLCHLDKSMRWTVLELERGWGRQLSLPAQGRPATSIDLPVGEVWLTAPEATLRLLAAQSYARSPLGPSKLRDLLVALNDPEPINRVFALKAVERVRGKPLARDDYELTAPPAMRVKQIERLLSRGGPEFDAAAAK